MRRRTGLRSLPLQQGRPFFGENQSHDVFEDHWADSQKHDVVACDEVEARRMVAERFKPDDGFVIEGVV